MGTSHLRPKSEKELGGLVRYQEKEATDVDTARQERTQGREKGKQLERRGQIMGPPEFRDGEGQACVSKNCSIGLEPTTPAP